MSGSLAPKRYEKKPQKYWDNMVESMHEQALNSPVVIAIDRDPVPARPILFSEEEYDTLNPEENIKNFCSFIRQVISRYDNDRNRLSELEAEMQDVLHYTEMSKSKDVLNGYKIYKKLCEIRRERRACKNEIDLLQPIYEMFHGTKELDQLARLQGTCKQIKKTIANKGYSVRTDALDEFIR